MRALDTPVLLRLLRGDPTARALARKIGAEELATTEINLWELTVLATEDRRPGRERRLEAIERLRRKLGVLPVDAAALAAATRRRREATDRGETPSVALMIAALVGHGIEELITTRESRPWSASVGLRIVYLEEIAPKKRKNRTMPSKNMNVLRRDARASSEDDGGPRRSR
jgi:predicted nucleic acid-binding protein